MENIVQYLIPLAIAIITALLIVVLVEVKKHLAAKIEAQKATEIDKLIYQFVCAAEQLLKASDPTGEKRNAYVLKLLSEIGVVITDVIKAKIEADVLKMPKDN